MEKFVYVLFIENKVNFEPATIDTMVFDNLELARNNLAKLKADFMKEIENDTCDYVFEEDDDDYFEAYESGFYNENHFKITIFEREINVVVPIIM